MRFITAFLLTSAVALAQDAGHTFTGSIDGRVVDVDGQPIPGAQVHWTVRYSANDRLSSIKRFGEGPVLRPTVPNPIDSDTRGYFVGKVRGVGMTQDMSNALVSLTATAPGFVATRTVEVDVESGAKKGPDVRIVLLRASRINGAIVNPEGKPVVDARVHLKSADGLLRTPDNMDASYAYLSTEHMGRFGMSGLPEGRWYVRMRRPGLELPPTEIEAKGGRLVRLGGLTSKRVTCVELPLVRPADAIKSVPLPITFRFQIDGAESSVHTETPLSNDKVWINNAKPGRFDIVIRIAGKVVARHKGIDVKADQRTVLPALVLKR